VVAYAHDSRRYDGLLVDLEVARRAVESPSVRVPVYTCFDPSLRAQYPELGTMLSGYRVPGGGDLERGVNRWFPVFARQLRGVPADLLHVWSVSLANVLRYRSDVVVTVPDIAKFTTRFYGRIPSLLHNRMLHYLPRARAIVCNTAWARGEIASALRLSADRIHIVSPTSPIAPPPFPLPRTAAPPTETAPWTLLHVAVDRPHKNIEFFLRVLAKTDARFRGLVISQPSSPTLALSRQLGLTNRIDFRSDLADLAPVYRGAQILVFPSLHEGFGLPLLEAMSQGLPVLASNRTCIPEVIGTGGRLLDPADPATWVAAIEQLTDPSEYREASRRAAERARSFTLENSRTQLMAAYTAALG
jgi:glycosyltransferase involved in cell wall biosynthesis